MLKNIFLRLGAIFLLVILSFSDATSQTEKFEQSVSNSVRQNFKRANELAERERFREALAELKKVIDKAPHFFPAHIRYINVKGYLMGQYDEVKSEYETLMAKNPANPIYPAALGIGLYSEWQQTKQGWFETVVKLAPDWTWSYYAKSELVLEKQPETAVAELLKMIDKEPSALQPYIRAIFIQEVRLKKIDDAIATAEKLMSQPDLRVHGQSALWRLRFKKAGSTEEAKTKLRQELAQFAASSKDIAMLAAVWTTYNDVLKDKEAAQAVERKITGIDAAWYPERGVTMLTSISLNFEGGPISNVYSGRQLYIHNKLSAIDFSLETQEQITQVEKLLAINPDKQLKQSIYSRLFSLARRSYNYAATVKYGEALLALDTKNRAILATLAVFLANEKRDLEKALGYARRAEELTREFRLIKDIPDIAENKMFQQYYSEQQQAERHKQSRAIALDSYGWVLFKMGKYVEAETKVCEATELFRSESNLSHLSEVLRSLNRIEEADRFALEAKNAYAANIRRQFKNEPAKDFELSTIDGRKVKLSDLKGKVVMVNFWATWCPPCVKEMPAFVKAYEKYKDKGFEVLAITVDSFEDRPKVVSLASRQKITFPILYDENITKLYEVHGYPTTFFIGKQGTIRYQERGFFTEGFERNLGTIIEELLKDN